jgi:hypothetical protein
MARAQVPFFALNAGEVSKAALGRVDLEKMRLAAESMVNFTPTVLGPMSLRAGLKYGGSTLNDAQCRLIPFVFNASTTSLLELTTAGLRVRSNDTLISYPDNATTILGGDMDGVSATWTRTLTTVTVTRANHGLVTGNVIYAIWSGGAMSGETGYFTVTVTSANTFDVTSVGSGTTNNNVTYYPGWTNTSTLGANATFANNQLVLSSTEYSYARSRQSVSVALADRTILHCVRVAVARGPVIFRIGSTAGGNEIITNQTLDEGTHFIAFTPNNATVHIEIEAINAGRATRLVDSVTLYRNANLTIPLPYAAADLNRVRFAQSGSVIFLACSGYPQYKVERRGANSWGVAKYLTSSGPYLGYSTRKEKLKCSALTGNVTVNADQTYFTSNMVGSIFQITHPQQRVEITFTGVDQYSDWIRVVGVGTQDRQFRFSITYNAGATGTITLERAFATPEGWLTTNTYTTAQANTAIDDSNTTTFGASSNNLVVYYRLAARPGTAFTGTVTCSLIYEGGQKTGEFRLTGVSNGTTAQAEVIQALGSVEYTDDWREGSWSNARSWPSSVGFHDGRLWWAGLDKVYGSVSDDYYNFDPETEGDSGPIVRSVATGPVEGIGWMLPLQRLVVGTASSEVSIRSSSFDEPLTPTQFTARNASTIGSAPVQAIAVDSAGIYVQRNKTKIFELVYGVESNDYESRELTRLNQQICSPGVVQIAAQRQPDTRIWFVKEDGTLAMLLYDRSDNVVGWSRVVTDGFFENVAILPTGEDDDVYFVIRRTINGITRRYIEKFASFSELDAGGVSYYVDSSVRFQSETPTATITGLSHLIGKEVVIFAPRFVCFDNGGFDFDAFQSLDPNAAEPRTTYTVSPSGTIVLDFPVKDIVIGLAYQAQFKSVKLAYGSQSGTALTQKKRVDHLAIMGLHTAPDGLRIGRDFDNMTKLSNVFRGKPLDDYFIVPEWDYEATAFGGKFDTDSRVCITAQSPYPATIQGMVIHLETNDRG